MRQTTPRSSRDAVEERLYDLKLDDSTSEVFDRSSFSPEDLEQISRLMRALANLKETEQAILDASEKYMKLSTQDMRALHYLIVAKRQAQVVTPSMIAKFLSISPASTTKLLNRLEQGGHITRSMHPTDRRALVIEISPATEASAKQTVGKQHARRVYAAARLDSEQRETVIRFLEDMAQEISMANADWVTQ